MTCRHDITETLENVILISAHGGVKMDICNSSLIDKKFIGNES